MAQTQIKDISWWHESIIDWMLANPEKTLRQCAEHFEVTQSWLSVIKNSDCFRDLWETRRADYSSRVNEGLSSKLTRVAELSLDAQIDKLEAMGPLMELDDLRKAGNDAIRALGYGAKPSVNITTEGGDATILAVDSDTLAEARRRIAQRNEALALESDNVRVLPAAKVSSS